MVKCRFVTGNHRVLYFVSRHQQTNTVLKSKMDETATKKERRLVSTLCPQATLTKNVVSSKCFNQNSESVVYKTMLSTNSSGESQNLEAVLTDTVLKLEEIDTDLYRGSNLWRPVGARAVFGGQIIGQAMAAASRTKPANVSVHSMHCYFIRPGNPKKPIIYHVDRTLDGNSFSNRFVKAVQNGEALLSLQMSYHRREVSEIEYQCKMPHVPPPEEVPNLEEKFKEFLSYDSLTDRQRQYVERRLADEVPIDLRPLDPEGHFRIAGEEREPKQMFWIRARGHIGDDMELHRCVAAYMSDLTMISTALSGFQGFRTTMAASLDHAMWFHTSFKADEFMLYECRSTRTTGARCFTSGRVWRRDGTLAMSVSQEGVVRGNLRPEWSPTKSIHNPESSPTTKSETVPKSKL